MPIQYVGGVQGGRAGATSTLAVSLNGTLSGGLATSPAAKDFVVVTVALATTETYAPTGDLAVTTAGYVSQSMFAPTALTYCAFLQISYKFMPSTPDTDFTVPSCGSVRNAQRWIAKVYRNVHIAEPLGLSDLGNYYSFTNNSGRPLGSAITPSSWDNLNRGIWICTSYAQAAGTGIAFTNPGGLDNWLGGTTADTYDIMLGNGDYTSWTSGLYQAPDITAGGTTGANDSGISYQIMLRPVTVGIFQSPTNHLMHILTR